MNQSTEQKLTRNIDQHTTPIDLNTNFGERASNGYRMQGLYEIFFNLADGASKGKFIADNQEDSFVKAIKAFNEMIKKQSAEWKNAWLKKPSDDERNNIKAIPKCLVLLDDEEKKLQKVCDSFLSAYDKIALTDDCYEKKCVEEYLNAYIDIFRILFEDKCVNQEELRSLDIIETLLNINFNEEEDCFGLYSPFVVFSVWRTIKYISMLDGSKNGNDNDSENELNRRKHLAATYGINALSRFAIHRKKSYIVEYSRQKDRIVRRQSEYASSIEDLKPIRMLEKIQSHMLNMITDSKIKQHERPNEVNVVVFGFCPEEEGESADCFPEIVDLANALLGWQADTEEFKKNPMKINLKYLVIKASDADKQRKETAEQEKETPLLFKYSSGKVYYCNFSRDFRRKNDFNKDLLKQEIESNDILFLIDCPWLVTEKFDLENSGNLSSYLNWLNRAEFKDDLQLSSTDIPFFSKNTLFSSLNDQLNRLAISGMSKYGKVVRILKDYMLRWLEAEILNCKEQQQYKTVYLYFSSMRGMYFSRYLDYPILREERYSNKRFNILRFSSRENSRLNISDYHDTATGIVYISLWSLLKYYDISFIYKGLQKYLVDIADEIVPSDSCRNEETKQNVIRRKLFLILQGIVFSVNYDLCSEKAPKVTVKLHLKKAIREAYNKAFSENGSKDENVRKLLNYFSEIIQEILFQNTSGFGDICIRDAFEICLYNQARTVSDIFFHQWYSEQRKKGELKHDGIAVKLNDFRNVNDDTVDRLNPNFDTFGDKRIYKNLLEYLAMPKPSAFAVHAQLNEANKRFERDNDTQGHGIQILKNLARLCETSGETDTYLYENINRLL